MEEKTAYLDNAATTRACPAAVEAVARMMRDCFGNPSSLHAMGLASAREMAAAREAVAALLGDNREQLTAAANRVLSAEGFGYTADTELCSMVFPNRVYGSKVLPAGRYDAVRVTLGQAGGQNWWCVLFPQLCIPTALADPVELEDLLTDEQAELVDNGARYELRFALWEFLVSLFE